jgi:hypothetical protein
MRNSGSVGCSYDRIEGSASEVESRAAAVALGSVFRTPQRWVDASVADVACSGESDTHAGVRTWETMLRFRSRMRPEVFEDPIRVELLAIDGKR